MQVEVPLEPTSAQIVGRQALDTGRWVRHTPAGRKGLTLHPLFVCNGVRSTKPLKKWGAYLLNSGIADFDEADRVTNKKKSIRQLPGIALELNRFFSL